jgi:hypothetical protein
MMLLYTLQYLRSFGRVLFNDKHLFLSKYLNTINTNTVRRTVGLFTNNVTYATGLLCFPGLRFE